MMTQRRLAVRNATAGTLLTASLLIAAGCGGGGSGPTPPKPTPAPTAAATASPSPSPTPTPPLLATPQSLNVNGLGATYAASLTISEAGFSGSFVESDTCAGVAAIATQSALGPSAVFVVTGIAAGACTATFAGASSQTRQIPIDVTQSGILINGFR